METKDIITIIISILGSIATAISTFFIVYKHFLYKKEKRKELTDELNKIIEIAIRRLLKTQYFSSSNF